MDFYDLSREESEAKETAGTKSWKEKQKSMVKTPIYGVEEIGKSYQALLIDL